MVRTKEEVVQEFRIQSIREAASRVIGREGLEGATMQAIAKEAGVAKGTIYLYFEDREDLVLQTADHAFSRLLEALDAVFSSKLPFRQQLRQLLDTVFAFFDQDRDFFRLYLTLRVPQGIGRDTGFQVRLRPSQYVAYLGMLEKLLEQAMELGEIRAMNPSLLAQFMTEGINSILIMRLEDPIRQSENSDSDWLLTTILDGIGVRD